MNKNPFSVLGLDPSALTGLNDEQIDLLVKGISRAMQKICHPDITKATKLHDRSVQINEAVKLLDRKKYPEGFANWKKDFCKKTPMKRKLDKALADIQKSRFAEMQSYLQVVNALSKFCFEVNCEGEVCITLKIHNSWVSTGGYNWLSPRNEAAFYMYDLDEVGHVLSSSDISWEKCIVGSIDEKYYINHLITDLKNMHDDLAKKRQIATVNALRNGSTSFRGPMITKDHYSILLPHIDFTSNFKIGGYIVSINRRGEDLFFQIDGSIKEVKTYNE